MKPIAFDSESLAALRPALEKDGVARVNRVFSPQEIETLRLAVRELMVDAPESDSYTWRSITSGGTSVIQRISCANRFSPVISTMFMRSRQLLTLGEEIFGVSPERVRIANGEEGSDGIVLVIKDPANTSVHRDLRWHRDDSFTQHLAINPFVNCGLYLDQSDSLRGGLLVIPRKGGSSNRTSIQETSRQVEEQICIEASPGDVIIHASDVWHRSGPHYIKGEVRRVLYANLYAL